MEFKEKLKDDLLQYGKVAGIVMAIFVLAGIGLFFFTRPRCDVVLARDEIEYGEPIKTSDLVERIGDFKIKEDQIRSGTLIVLPEYEVVMNELDSGKLGEQDLVFKFSDDELPDITKMVRIVDTTPPEITLHRSEIELSLEDYRKADFMQEISVTDSCSKDTDLKVEGKASAEPDPGTEFDYVITAEDGSGNQSEVVIKVRILEEKKEEENTVSDPKEDGSSKEPELKMETPMVNPEPVQPVAPSVQQPVITPPVVAPPVQRPANRSYMFSDGYTMQTAPSACQSDLMASGASGACIPIQDADGIYKGMQLIFD